MHWYVPVDVPYFSIPNLGYPLSYPGSTLTGPPLKGKIRFTLRAFEKSKSWSKKNPFN